MTQQTILIVDDDPKVRTLLRHVLEDDGFAVHEVERADQVAQILDDFTICLVTLDVNLGTESGVELARAIRRTSQVPIIMITGKDDVIDRVVGLEVGADDYVTKPFHVREVLARVRSVLRRSDMSEPVDLDHIEAPQHSVRFYFDGMTAALDEMTLMDRNGSNCALTSGDFKLLEVFLKHSKRVLSRDRLVNLTDGHDWNPLDRAIDNQVARLRKKIERDPSHPQLIKTVRGIGYTFACDVSHIQPSEVSPKSA